jgi:hypothetical protein
VTRIVVIVCIFICVSASAQDSTYAEKFPAGVYMTIEQLKNKTPQFNIDLNVIRRTQGDIGFNGGNDYEITSSVDSIKKKFIKKSVYAYVKNDSLFLNCIHQGLSTWYAYCQTKGNFLAFSGGMSDSKALSEAAPYGFMFGAIGGGIAAANASKKRFLYVLSLRTGNVRSLTKVYMTERLKEHQTLLEQYNTEVSPDSANVLVKYTNLLNEVTPITSTPPQPLENK